MRKAASVALIVGFLLLDWLRFHDILKPGERMSPADWLTGLLSLLAFYLAIDVLSARNRTLSLG